MCIITLLVNLSTTDLCSLLINGDTISVVVLSEK